MPETDLLVSIVNYRTPDLLTRCLQALALERLAWRDMLSVTVSDNASHDGSAEAVRRQFPWVQLHVNPENLGFGRAHNRVLRGATARYLLILNADAEVQPGSLRKLTEFLDTHPDVAVVGPRLRYPDGNIQPSRRRFPTVVTFFLESTQLERFLPNHREVRRYALADRPEALVQDVDWLVGAALCVRSAAAREIGLFDERYFLYSEELDWCRRFRAAGWRVVYVPTAEVQHVEGGSSQQDLVARDIHFQRAKQQYVRKWHGTLAANVLWSYVLLEYLARGTEEILKVALGSRVSERLGRLRIIRGYLREVLSARRDSAFHRTP